MSAAAKAAAKATRDKERKKIPKKQLSRSKPKFTKARKRK